MIAATLAAVAACGGDDGPTGGETPGSIQVAVANTLTKAVVSTRPKFAGNVSLSLQAPPAGIIGTFAPATTTTNTSTATIAVGQGTATGVYPIAIAGSGPGGTTALTTFTLTVAPVAPIGNSRGSSAA